MDRITRPAANSSAEIVQLRSVSKRAKTWSNLQREEATLRLNFPTSIPHASTVPERCMISARSRSRSFRFRKRTSLVELHTFNIICGLFRWYRRILSMKNGPHCDFNFQFFGLSLINTYASFLNLKQICTVDLFVDSSENRPCHVLEETELRKPWYTLVI